VKPNQAGKKDRRNLDRQRRCKRLPVQRTGGAAGRLGKISVMALSVSERELQSADASRLVGHMAARIISSQ
jgi:hypothetical protein